MTLLRVVARRGVPALLVGLCLSCASPETVPRAERGDPVFVQTSSAARLAYRQGHFEQAQKMYTLALRRARAINDPALAADAAYNLGVSEIRLGDYAAAARLLDQAHYDAVRASSNAADIQLVRAKVAFLRMRHPETLALLDGIATLNPSQSIRLQAMILRGQVFAEAGNEKAASLQLQSAQALVTSSQPVLPDSVNADLAKLEGTVARLGGEHSRAARIFDREAELLRVARRYRDMAYALARAAETFNAAGEPALAADRFFLAARGLEGLGDVGAARAFLASSISAANEASDHDARARAEALLEEFTRRHAP